ncbi:MAG: formylglycine-generating enzyme family protein [bacterium]
MALIKIIMITLFLINGCQGRSSSNYKAPEDSLIFDYKNVMVKIPGGKVLIGSDPALEEKKFKGELGQTAFRNESPVHEVQVKPFYLDKYEVSINAYNRFIKATGHRLPRGWEKIKLAVWGSYPIVNVSWDDASAYARWAGKRLPSEAEWELAARGRQRRRYPWGNEYDKEKANFPAKGLLPVGSNINDISPSGIMDMAGNAAEWTADLYQAYPGNKLAHNKKERVVRGNSFGTETQAEDAYLSRGAHRDHQPAGRISEFVGFRCALNIEDYKPPVSRKPSLKGMIKVPSGQFTVGTEKGEKFPRSFGFKKPLYENESPSHRMYLDEFYIDKYEVTIGKYKKFLEETGYFRNPWHWAEIVDAGLDDFPEPYVTWEDASAYARWAGKRLPTEFEWEKAARGDDGRTYPWGESNQEDIMNRFKRKILPAGSKDFDKSPYGLMDMGGNVAEWTSSWYLPYPGCRYPDKDYGRIFKVIKGGANIASGHYRLLRYNTRSAYRAVGKPVRKFRDVGFRCAY